MFPSHPLFRRFENELVLGKQKLEWTMRGADLFARPVGSTLDIVWCWPTVDVLSLRGGNSECARTIVIAHKPYRFYGLSERDALFLKASHGFLRSHNSPLLLRFSLPPRFWQRARVLSVDAQRLYELVAGLMAHGEFQLVQELATQVNSPWKWLVWERGSLAELDSLIKALFVLVGDGEFSFSPLRNYESSIFTRH